MNGEGVFLAYFFCNEKDSHRCNLVDVLKLLIRQMLFKERGLAEHLLVEHSKRNKGDQNPKTLTRFRLLLFGRIYRPS